MTTPFVVVGEKPNQAQSGSGEQDNRRRYQGGWGERGDNGGGLLGFHGMFFLFWGLGV
jgi:hypothetical protein